MRLRAFALFAAGFLCMFGMARAQTFQTTVLWVVQDFPPAQIPDNGKPGKGFHDDALRLIVENWPEAEHQYVVANAARTWMMLSDKEQVCFVGALQTPEREKIAYFTPFAVLPPLQLVVRKESFVKLPLNPDGEVLLQELFANTALTGMTVNVRSYGKAIDEEIAHRARKEAIAVVQPSDLGKSVPLMLAAKRGDYIFEYDFILNYHKQQNLRELNALVAVPIAGYSKVLTTNVVCSRSSWGQQAIRRIDSILTKTADDPTIRASVEKWLSPETIKRYKAEMNAFAQRRHKLSDPALFQP